MDRLDTQNIVIGKKKLIIPFELDLNKGGDGLQCSQLLRFVPGRRAVFSGLWGKKKIIAKFFFKPLRYKNHVKKEIRGNDLFKLAGIPASKILYSRFCKELKGHILIFEFIDNSMTFKKIFELDCVMGSDNLKITRKKHLISLIRLIAKMHQKGLIHNDLHPDNFLLKNGIIYALDSASIKQISISPLEKKISLENLAIIVSQINIKSKNLLYDFAHAYARERRYQNTDQVAEQLENFVEKSNNARIARYLKKIYRSSTKILCKRSFSSFLLCHRKYYTPAMESFLQNPETAFHNPGVSLLKTGNTATLVRCKIDGIEFVVKRYNMKNFFHALRLAFKKSRADRSWCSAHLLMKNRINTPKPVAFKEKRFGPFRNKAYFICEYIDGKSARDFFPAAREEKAEIQAEAIIEVFDRLKTLKISHGDMKATNIIIQDGKPFLIDLDSMTWYKKGFWFFHARKKDIDRFMKNWKNNSQTAGLFKKLQG